MFEVGTLVQGRKSSHKEVEPKLDKYDTFVF